MARLDEVQRAALANWWDLAQSAANSGFTVTDTVTAASQLARDAGRSLTFAESAAISTLYGFARRMANAAGELAGDPSSFVIDPTVVAVPPWARDEQVMNTTPIWHVTYTFNYLDQGGVLQSKFVTSIFEMTLPDTVGELSDAIAEDAQQLADKYNVTLQGAELHSILAV
jgi:hypothetical protein